MPQPRSASRSHDVYVARESYSTSIDGVPVIINKGKDRARAGHPLVTQNPSMWEPVDLSVQWDVPATEDASAEPGVKRGEGKSQEAALSKTRVAPTESTREKTK